MKINIENRKNNEKDKGAALYLVVVFTAIAVSLLMFMYSNLSSTAITYITEMTTTQEEFYLESAAEMVRAGKTQTQIDELFAEFGWSNVSISMDSNDYAENESVEDADSTADEESSEDADSTADEESSEDADSTTEDETSSSTSNEYQISLEDGSLVLSFTLKDGKYSNYYFTEKVEDDE
ncbi:MAG: hypothetical protein R3Y27_02675 [Clostridia bacterium]